MRPTLLSLAALLAVAAVSLPTVAAGKGAATVAVTEGRVLARPSGHPRWQPAKVRQILAIGDTVRTGRKSRAELAFADGTVTRLAQHSLLRLAPQSRSFGQLLLGKLWFRVTRQHAPIRIETPSAVATVVGTELIVSVDRQESTHITCLEGHVQAQGEVGPAVALTAGQWTDIRKGQAAEPPTPFDWNRLRATETLLHPLQQDDGQIRDDEDPDDIWKSALLR